MIRIDNVYIGMFLQQEIINILHENKITFVEINTYESDLKDVFINLIKK